VLRPPRAEPGTARQEIRLENRIEHDLHSGLHDPVANRRNRKRPPLVPHARLRDIDPPRGHGPVAAFPQLAGQLVKQPGNPVLLDGGQGDLVDTRRAIVPAHRDPRAPQNIPAEDLVMQRVEPPPGIGLGRPVKRMLQGTDRIRRDNPGRPRSGGTSHDGTHRAPPDRRCAPTKQRPFPHRRLCCPPGSSSTTAASDAHPASHPLPGITGYRTPRSGSRNPQTAGPGRASPVPAATIGTFRAPYAGESLTAAPPGSSPLPWPSPRFREARHSLARPERRMSNDAAGFA
jgi:hypothetical protein